MNINPKITAKLESLCGDDKNLYKCLVELFYFELLNQKDYTSVYEQYISEFAFGGTDEDN